MTIIIIIIIIIILILILLIIIIITITCRSVTAAPGSLPRRCGSCTRSRGTLHCRGGTDQGVQ
jgi:hypothetical protein